MSATIKPAAWMCRGCGAMFHDEPDPACCQMLDADGGIDMDPLFTRADLVAAVSRGFALGQENPRSLPEWREIVTNEIVAELLGEQKGGG